MDLAQRRLRARRLSALREFAAEHGESALRALGGRREAQRLLDSAKPRGVGGRAGGGARGGTKVSRRRERGSGRRPAQSGTGSSGEPPKAAARGGGAPQSGRGWAPGPPLRTAGLRACPSSLRSASSSPSSRWCSLIADLAGAANLGVALGIGQIAFAIALVAVIVKN